MVKVKKFFILLVSGLFCCFFTISLTGCSKNEVEKESKNLSSYAVSATIESESKISASETVLYVNKTGTELSEILFHLYPRAFREDALIRPYTSLTVASCFPNGASFGDMEIISVKCGGENVSYEIVGEDEDILKVSLPDRLKQNAKLEIAIDFCLTLPNCTHRFGYYDGNINLGNWYPIACEFSGGKFDTTPYYATGDPFFSSVANYSVEISYPSEYKLLASGKVTSEVSGNTTTSKIEQKAVRDFAMCLSNDSVIVSKKVGDTEISYMGYATDSDLQTNLEVSASAVEYFGKTFGKFPYATLCVVKTPFIYGGMEYPNIVLVSDSIDSEEEFKKVIVHEIAHQWWYSVVGNNESTEAWLDESLAEYSVALFFKNNPKYKISYDDLVSSAVSSYLLYVDVIGTIRGDVCTKMNLAVKDYQNDYEYSYMIYVKGVIMFDELKKAVGENKLIAGFKKYFEDNKFKIASKQDFYNAFKDACHKDLEGFFEGYLGGTTVILAIN